MGGMCSVMTVVVVAAAVGGMTFQQTVADRVPKDGDVAESSGDSGARNAARAGQREAPLMGVTSLTLALHHSCLVLALKTVWRRQN